MRLQDALTSTDHVRNITNEYSVCVDTLPMPGDQKPKFALVITLGPSRELFYAGVADAVTTTAILKGMTGLHALGLRLDSGWETPTCTDFDAEIEVTASTN